MGERAREIGTVAAGQIEALVAALSGADRGGLGAPCAGREKLGDGTVGALASHTADNYARLGAFVAGDGSDAGIGSGHRRRPHGRFRHRHAAASVEPGDLVDRLDAAREALEPIADLTDAQLDAIPPEGSFKFCDGKRSLDEVLTGVLKHQAHQVEALEQALG